MERDVQQLTAIFLGYGVPLLIWFAVTRLRPALWPDLPDPEPGRPVLDFALALGAMAAVFGLNILYNADLLFAPGPENWARDLVFLLNLLIIWSPVFAILIVRRQGPVTSLLPVRGLPIRLAWALAATVGGMAIYLLAEGRWVDLPLAVTTLWAVPPIKIVQSLIQFFGFAFVLVRLKTVAGRTIAVSTVSILYGVAKYPYYVAALGMSWPAATSLIVFNIVVAFVVIYVIMDRRDLLVPAILHVFMDRIQEL